MELKQSGEDYLEAILVLQKKNGSVLSVDVAAHLGFAKSSVSYAVGLLRDGGVSRWRAAAPCGSRRRGWRRQGASMSATAP